MTITTRVNTCNHYYVTEICESVVEEEYESEDSTSDQAGIHRSEYGGGYMMEVIPPPPHAEVEYKKEEAFARPSPATAKEYIGLNQ